MNFAVTQGRLSPPTGNKIQSFPYKTWREEFKIANSIGIKNIEWVIDFETIETNPIFNEKGLNEISKLSKKYKIKIKTIQCDFLLHKPFWKKKYKKYENIVDEKINYLLKIKKISKNSILIMPLLENSKINGRTQEKFIVNYFKSKTSILKKYKNKIAFEIDYNPNKLKKFINLFDKKYFGINYDTGNSISNKFDYNDELKSYFNNVLNIHYKDKDKKNKTVYLGNGKFTYPDFYKKIKKINYNGLITLQAARAKDFSETDLIKTYISDLKNSMIKKKFSFGIMQGRTKERKIDNICPKNWENEFKIAVNNNFEYIEMIVDKNLSKHNPLLSKKPLPKNIKKMVYSINFDYFAHNKINSQNFKLFYKITKFANDNNFKLITIPLIEKSSLKLNELRLTIKKISESIKNFNVKIAFEIDNHFDEIIKFNNDKIGICYDVGNLRKTRNIYNDIEKYHKKIYHFHFKDYKIKNRSNFSNGSINFCKLIGILKKVKYNYKITFEGLSGIKNNIINKNYLESII
jgi:L-ribulose-5-phosphate 3-epimerase